MNLLEKMLNLNENKDWIFTSKHTKPFTKHYNVLEFINKHIIELSEIVPQSQELRNNWIDTELENYLRFISAITKDPVTPEKSVDLIFHFHMLHPHEFIQDGWRLAKTIKPHNFNFAK